jgi:hypothetical protein
MIRLSIQAVVVAALTASSLAQAQWTAVRLHSPGTWSSGVLGISPTSQVGYRTLTSGSLDRATLWSGTAESAFTLSTPNSLAAAISGSHQGGVFNGHASLWMGAPESRIDLHPSSALISSITGMTEQQQVGYASYGSTDQTRATLWSGSAASALSLHPNGAVRSIAVAASGDQQGGWATFPLGAGQGDAQHAALWSGSAASFVDLNPSSSYISSINGMSAGQQAGVLHAIGGVDHAAVWAGTPGTVRDLNPFPGAVSTLNGTTGDIQVGFCSSPTTGALHAGVWFDSATSFFSLGSVLPAGYTSSSATCVCRDGNTLYVGGYAVFAGGNPEAFLWIGTVPAPSSAGLAVIGLLLAAGRRRAR